jgi:hypothetical protein
MPGCLFLLHPSLQSPANSPFLDSPDSTVTRLLTTLKSRYSPVNCAAWQLSEWSHPDVFDHHGIGGAEASDPPAWLQERLATLAPETEVIIASDPTLGLAVCESLAPWRCQVWALENFDDSRVHSLLRMLKPPHPRCSLFVDWPFLQQLGASAVETVDTAAISRHLTSLASMAGEMIHARAYGVPGESPVADLLIGGSQLPAAELSLANDFALHLARESGPHNWIVMAPKRGVPSLPEEARASGQRFILWSDEDSTPRADTFIDARRLLHGLRLPQPPETTLDSFNQEPMVDATIGYWVRLAYFIDCAQRLSSHRRLDVGCLAESLLQREECGPQPDAAEAAIRRAQDFGLLQILDDDQCRLNANHPAARFAVEVPDRILRLLNQMLQRMPWVSFKLLRSVLAREQWLGGAAYGLDEPQIDDWINFLIRDGALSMSKEPNLVAPEFPVTALRINPVHALTGAPPQVETGMVNLARERAILAVDHFLQRQHKPWMSMGALRRALDRLGRDELQDVLRALQIRRRPHHRALSKPAARSADNRMPAAL